MRGTNRKYSIYPLLKPLFLFFFFFFFFFVYGAKARNLIADDRLADAFRAATPPSTLQLTLPQLMAIRIHRLNASQQLLKMGRFFMRSRRSAQLLMANRIRLNGLQQLLLNTGRGVVNLGASCLVLYLAAGGANPASPAHALLLLLLILSGFAFFYFTEVVPYFPRAARNAAQAAHKLNHIFFSGPP